MCQGCLYMTPQRQPLQRGHGLGCWTLRQLRQERLLLVALLRPVGQRPGQAGRAGLPKALPHCRGDRYASFEPQPLSPHAYNDAWARWHAWTCTGEASNCRENSRIKSKRTSNKAGKGSSMSPQAAHCQGNCDQFQMDMDVSWAVFWITKCPVWAATPVCTIWAAHTPIAGIRTQSLKRMTSILAHEAALKQLPVKY